MDTFLLFFFSFPISMEWNGEAVAEKVVWFQHETDDSLNSNVFEVAQKMVQKHFPGNCTCIFDVILVVL